MEDEKIIEAEIVEDEFKAPILRDIKYPVAESDLVALVEKYKNVPNIDLDAEDEVVAEQYKIVRDGHIELSKKRNQIEKTRKAIKDPAFTFGKNVDAFAKKLQSIIADTEIKLKFQRDKVDQNEARKQREAEEAEELRIDTIKKLMTEMQMLPLKYTHSSSYDIQTALDAMVLPDEETFNEFLDSVMTIYNESLSQLKQMFDNKILVENAQKIQDEQKEEQLQKEIKIREDQKEELAKIAKEREEFEREKQEFADKQNAIQEEADRKQADKDANELMEKQEAEKVNRDKEARRQMKELYDEAISDLTDLEYKNVNDILEAIIDGEIRHVKWDMS